MKSSLREQLRKLSELNAREKEIRVCGVALFASLLLCYFLVFYGSLSPLLSSEFTILSIFTYKGLTQGGFIVGLFVAGHLKRKSSLSLSLVASAVLGLGYVVILAAYIFASLPALVVPGLFLLGMGCGVGLIHQILQCLRMKQTVIYLYVAGALVCAAVLYFGMSFVSKALPPAFSIAVLGVSLLAYIGLAAWLRRGKKRATLTSTFSTQGFAKTVPALACIGMVAFASSALGSSLFYLSTSFSYQIFISAVASVISAGIIVIDSIRGNRNIPRIIGFYLILFPFLASILLLVPFIALPWTVLVIMVANISNALMFFFVMIDAVSFNRHQSLDALLVAALLWASSALFSVLGFGLSWVLMTAFSDDGAMALGIAFLLLYVLSITAYVATKKRGTFAFVPETEASEDLLPQSLASISARFELTKRESEILKFLAQGRNVPSIAASLYLSENTVWTHTKKIYRTMGVHSRQELLDIIEEEKNRLTETR